MLFGFFYLYLFTGWGPLFKMVEIFFVLICFILSLLVRLSSLLGFIGVFFLLRATVSLARRYIFSGWAGVVVFLVFNGGILVIALYLGLFGKYYKFFKYLGLLLLTCFLFRQVSWFCLSKNFNYGERSDFFYKPSYFIFTGVVLFFSLFFIRKATGVGRALRRSFLKGKLIKLRDSCSFFGV